MTTLTTHTYTPMPAAVIPAVVVARRQNGNARTSFAVHALASRYAP